MDPVFATIHVFGALEESLNVKQEVEVEGKT